MTILHLPDMKKMGKMAKVTFARTIKKLPLKMVTPIILSKKSPGPKKKDSECSRKRPMKLSPK